MGTVSSAAVPGAQARGPVRLAGLGDELLARYAARGSERAYAAVYERYHQALYRYCRSIVRNDADAQDALQSTFTGALAALRRGQRSAPLRPWLYRIAHNESVSVLRRRARESDAPLDAESVGTSSSAEEEAAGRARWEALIDDLAELPERQRGALLLRELAGLSHEEIAVALGLTVGGAKQAIFEARQGLTEVQEGRAMSCEDVRHRISAGDRRVLRGRRVRAHLRDCSGCDAFARAIPARRAELLALAPVLPPAAAATVLSRAMQAASPHGGASAAATAGAVGKAAGTAVAWKAVGSAAVVITAAAGVTGLTHVLGHTHGHPGPAAVSGHRAAAHSRSGAGGGAYGVARSGHAPAPGAHGKVSGHAGAAAAAHQAGKQGHRGPGQASGHRTATHGPASLGPTRTHTGVGSLGHRLHGSQGRSTSSPGRTVSHRTHRHGSTHARQPTSSSVPLSTLVTSPVRLQGKHGVTPSSP